MECDLVVEWVAWNWGSDARLRGDLRWASVGYSCISGLLNCVLGAWEPLGQRRRVLICMLGDMLLFCEAWCPCENLDFIGWKAEMVQNEVFGQVYYKNIWGLKTKFWLNCWPRNRHWKSRVLGQYTALFIDHLGKALLFLTISYIPDRVVGSPWVCSWVTWKNWTVCGYASMDEYLHVY